MAHLKRRYPHLSLSPPNFDLPIRQMKDIKCFSSPKLDIFPNISNENKIPLLPPIKSRKNLLSLSRINEQVNEQISPKDLGKCKQKDKQIQLTNIVIYRNITKTNNSSSRPIPIEQEKDSSNNNQKENLINSYFNFSKYHNRNLSLIKKLSTKAEASKLHNMSSSRNETSMQRFQKIQRVFQVKNNEDGTVKIYHRKYLRENSLEQSINNNQHKEVEQHYYYYTINHGNNSELIERCMKNRSEWKECPSDKQPHFLWSPTSLNLEFSLFSKLKSCHSITNHYEFHSQLTNKLLLFSNMMSYCEARNIDLFNYVPLTVLIQYDSQRYLKQFLSFINVFNNIASYVSENRPDISNKRRYRDFFELEGRESIGKRTSFYIKASHYDERNLWMIKAIDLNRGRCIKYGRTIDEIEKIIKLFYIGVIRDNTEVDKENNDNAIDNEGNKGNDKQLNEEEKKVYFFPNIKSKQFPSLKDFKPTKETYRSGVVILQKYIEKPLLYHGRKFDLRLWVMLSHKMDIYVFKEGHLKASSFPYEIDNRSSYIHLTNYSVQKKGSNFAKYEKGNEISFEDFQQCINNEHKKSLSFRNDIFPELCNIVKISMKSVRKKINMYDRKHTFEIFGYDFMFDINCKPFLIEVNTNPGLEISSPLVEKIVPRMIEDALKLTIDDVFSKGLSSSPSNNRNSYHVDGYEDNENIWELIDNINGKNDNNLLSPQVLLTQRESS